MRHRGASAIARTARTNPIPRASAGRCSTYSATANAELLRSRKAEPSSVLSVGTLRASPAWNSRALACPSVFSNILSYREGEYGK
jgi:hypothetical protein